VEGSAGEKKKKKRKKKKESNETKKKKRKGRVKWNIQRAIEKRVTVGYYTEYL